MSKSLCMQLSMLIGTGLPIHGPTARHHLCACVLWPCSNSENMTPKYPDIAARIPGLLKPGVTSMVLDGEAVAWDPAAKKVLPFQVCQGRGRLGHRRGSHACDILGLDHSTV
jgi:hypothetical protein